MSNRKGCFKNGCLGCLGLIVLTAIFLVGGVALVKQQRGPEQAEDLVFGSENPVSENSVAEVRPELSEGKPAPGRGWLLLDFSQGDFRVHRGEPGTRIVVKAKYDVNAFELAEYRHTWPDSAWVYQVRFHQTTSGLAAFFHNIVSNGDGPVVHVYIPPDLPLELNVRVRQGSFVGDLGGLWLTDVDLRFDMAGVDLEVSDPLLEPLHSFVLTGRMGGADITGLGNASPRVLVARCRMGGVSLDLAGDWRTDCDATLGVSMGGMEVTVPDNIRVDSEEVALHRGNQEAGTPVLRLQQTVEMGEIEIK